MITLKVVINHQEVKDGKVEDVATMVSEGHTMSEMMEMYMVMGHQRKEILGQIIDYVMEGAGMKKPEGENRVFLIGALRRSMREAERTFKADSMRTMSFDDRGAMRSMMEQTGLEEFMGDGKPGAPKPSGSPGAKAPEAKAPGANRIKGPDGKGLDGKGPQA